MHSRGAECAVACLQGHSNWVLCVAWSPDAAILATGGMDNSLWLWNPRTGQALGTCKGAHGRTEHCKSPPHPAWLRRMQGEGSVHMMGCAHLQLNSRC